MTEETEKPEHLPPEAFDTPQLKRELAEAILRERYARYPRFWEALEGDVGIFLKVRGEPTVANRRELVREALRLSWETDAFLALALYRIRGRLLARRVPVVPRLLHRASMVLCQLNIGEPVVIEPGVYIPHGQVVIDGDVEIGRGTVITPWVTIGLVEGKVDAPKIGRWTMIGTGAKILGKVTIGHRAKIGGNAVVLNDVPGGVTVVGAPARPVGARAPSEKMRRAIAEKRQSRSPDTDSPEGQDHRK